MPSRAVTKRNALKDLGWTTLSIAVAVILIPAVAAKTLAQAARPKKSPSAGTYEPYYLVN
jgi:hypothetical protein